MNYTGKISDLIPQAEPFIMISELVSVTPTQVHTKLLIKNDNVLCVNGLFLEPGLIENIAQSAAAMTGYNAVVNNDEVKKGFIGSVNNLEIHRLPKTGETLNTHVSIENQVMNVHIIQGTIYLGEELIARGEMKIFLEE